MTPGDFVPAYPGVSFIGDPRWIERLKRRQAAIQQLSKGLRANLGTITDRGLDDICAAVEYLLGAGIAEQLAEIEQMQKNPPAPLIPKGPRLEDLERAQQEVEQCQRGLEAIDAMIDDLPEATGNFIREVQRPMLEKQLAQSQDWLSTIQRAMESATGPDSYRWTVKRKGEDFFRVLEQPPILIHAVVRPAPDRPGQTEIAENEDGSLKIFPTEELGKRAVEAMGSDWEPGIFFLQPGIPESAALSNSSTPTEAIGQNTENPL